MARLRIAGMAAAPGAAVGHAYLARGAATAARRATGAVLSAAERPAELARLHAALARVAGEIGRLRDDVAARLGAAEAAVFDAQLLFLEDPALLEPMEAVIGVEGRPAAEAMAMVFDSAAATLDALDDPALRARAADLRDVRTVLSEALADAPHAGLGDPPDGAVVLAHDLTPSQTAGLRPGSVRGIALAAGSPTAHVAILARGLGLPLVTGAGDALWAVAAGERILVDGDAGLVLASPEEGEIAAGTTPRTPQAAAAPRAGPPAPAHTADGRRVALLANVGTAEEVALALAGGAEGIGLLRTEFLLAARDAADEEALAAAYEAILRPMEGRPVTVRAMDAGGDKPLPFLDMDREENPALGRRGIRLLLDRPDLFAGQVAALLRAAAHCRAEVRLLLPMITDAAEFRRARTLVEMVRRAAAYPRPLPVGAMIEVPAAALLAAALAAEADFLSLGTNDLAQYTLACDRGNPRVAALHRVDHPAVLRLVEMATRAARAAGRPIGVCGEAAGDPAIIPLLVGLGVDELSVGPARLPAARQCLERLRYAAARRLAAEALRQSTAEAVARLVAAG